MPPPTDDAALTRPAPLRYTLTPAFSSNTGPVVVLMSGWPDQPATLYAGLLSRLVAAGYRPALVELPGFPPPPVAPLPPRWWGWDTPQVVAGYAAAVRAIQAAAAAAPAAVGGTAAGAGAGAAPTPPPAPPVTFVAHDWGAVMTWRLVEAHPDVAAAIVGADVGDVGRIRSPAMLLFCALYMSVLAALFVVGGPVGDAGTRWVARLLGAPHPEAAAARMNALYFWTVRGQIGAAVRRVTGGGGVGRGGGGRGAGGAGEGSDSPARSPRKDVPPACPVLYLYGERKKGFQYHSAEWLAALRARPDCGVVPLDDSHWLMAGPAADVYEAAVMEWLTRTLGGGAPAPPPPHGAAATTAAAVSAAAAVASESKKEL